MKKEEQDLSRRNFLAASSAVIGLSLLAGETKAAPGGNTPAKNAAAEPAAMPPNIPVTDDGVQTLTNKTISVLGNNILGTETINIRESPNFPTAASSNPKDITLAINWGIDQLSIANTTSGKKGGQILIPRGKWESTGGHLLGDSISVEGVGYNHIYLSGYEMGTSIKMTGSGALFKITGPGVATDGIRNCSLKNLSIDMSANSSAVGLLLENTASYIIYATHVENVGFFGGAIGIQVTAPANTPAASADFECILNRFDRLAFINCATAFSCTTINSGFTFKNCYFSVPNNGTALDCKYMGNLALESCQFVGSQPGLPNQVPTNNTTILKTFGAFNNISFYDCQDESIKYYYQNSTTNPHAQVPLVFRNCLVQSVLKFTAPGTVIFDSCSLNVTNGAMQVTDSTATTPTTPLGGTVRIILQGLNNVFTQGTSTTTTFNALTNFYSTIINGPPEVTPPSMQTRTNRGTVDIPQGSSQVTVYNSLSTVIALIHAFLRTADPNNAQIKSCIAVQDSFTITLTQPAATKLSIGWVIEV